MIFIIIIIKNNYILKINYKMSLQNTSSDLVHSMMDYMDIPELLVTSTVCKNMLNDSMSFVTKIKNETTLKKLTQNHTCRSCLYTSYQVDKQFCNDCFLHKCDNCFAIRNSMSEFVKYVTMNTNGFNEIKLMCHDFCSFRCHNCKFTDSRHELFFNNNIELQTICVDCFINLDQSQKLKYDKVYHDQDEWDNLDAVY